MHDRPISEQQPAPAKTTPGPDYGLLMGFARVLTFLGLLLVAAALVGFMWATGLMLDVKSDVSPLTAFGWSLGLFLCGSFIVVTGESAVALRDVAANSWRGGNAR